MAKRKKRDRSAGGSKRWSLLNIALIVAGFFVHWIIGVGFLAFTLFSPRPSIGFHVRRFCDMMRTRSLVGTASFSRTSNHAFGAYREKELERIERERDDLDRIEREFEKFRRRRLQDKDQDEFNQFNSLRG